MKQYSKAISLAALVLLLTSCGGGDEADEPQAAWYHADAKRLQAEWLTQPLGSEGCEPLLAAPGEEPAALSKGPWWLDENHGPPGAGWLFLLAFAYQGNWSPDGVIAASGIRPSTDLRGATFRIRWRAPNLKLPPGASVSLWFQSRGETIEPDRREMVNYVHAGQPLATSGSVPKHWREDVITFAPRAEDYTCLGSNPNRTDLYGCRRGPVDALRRWDADLGIVVFMPERGMAEQVEGAIEISSITIDLDDRIATQAQAVTSRLRNLESTCRAADDDGSA